MKKISCIIVEDEPIAVKIIRSYLEQVSFMSLAAVCKNAFEAIDFLAGNKVDLIFLDIHLPALKGIDFLKGLKDPPKIIITTAYTNYAVEGFELDVSDYLMKPFSFPRFLKAVNKVKAGLDKEDASDDFYFFNVNKKLVKVLFKDILYVESVKDYVKIVYSDKHIVTKFQIGEMERILPASGFIRVHRGFIVSKSRIESFNSSEIGIGGRNIPVGRTYAEDVRMLLRSGK